MQILTSRCFFWGDSVTAFLIKCCNFHQKTWSIQGFMIKMDPTQLQKHLGYCSSYERLFFLRKVPGIHPSCSCTKWWPFRCKFCYFSCDKKRSNSKKKIWDSQNLLNLKLPFLAQEKTVKQNRKNALEAEAFCFIFSIVMSPHCYLCHPSALDRAGTGEHVFSGFPFFDWQPKIQANSSAFPVLSYFGGSFIKL